MRVVSQFSCGAASAVATKLVLNQQPDLYIINAFIKEEHPDNRRFLADCETWFGKPITVLRDQKYGASTFEVFRRKRFMKSRYGAPCSKALKRDVLNAYLTPDDTIVLGYTFEEQHRLDQFIDANNGRKVIAPLIDNKLTKADCLALVEKAGIELPEMYRRGFNNANCIGCVKGGEGYFNKVRREFPLQFAELAQIQQTIGPGAYLFRNRKTGERVSLLDLDPTAGRHTELLPDCGASCELVEDEVSYSDLV
jgi:3'-phosphoadenosine 5'-phosphosulfate sulfotransferase (PAPS reductase)/FAD synthetase